MQMIELCAGVTLVNMQASILIDLMVLIEGLV